MSQSSNRLRILALGAVVLVSCTGVTTPPPRNEAPPPPPVPERADSDAATTPQAFSPPVLSSATHQYLGCFKDQGTRVGVEGRDLNGAFSNDPRMTTQMCVDQCRAKGFAYAGTQRSTYCFCGNSYGRSGPAENCSTRCAGRAEEVCGGVWSNSVYAVGALAVQAPAAEKSVHLDR
jgi:hypothetical protein